MFGHKFHYLAQLYICVYIYSYIPVHTELYTKNDVIYFNKIGKLSRFIKEYLFPL